MPMAGRFRPSAIPAPARCGARWSRRGWTSCMASKIALSVGCGSAPFPSAARASEAERAIVIVQDVDDLKRAAEGIEAARRNSPASPASSRRRCPPFPTSSTPSIRSGASLTPTRPCWRCSACPPTRCWARPSPILVTRSDLADRLNAHIDRVLNDGVTVEDEVFYRSPTGLRRLLRLLWGPVRAEDGSIELVVGVSRDTTERRAIEEALKKKRGPPARRDRTGRPRRLLLGSGHRRARLGRAAPRDVGAAARRRRRHGRLRGGHPPGRPGPRPRCDRRMRRSGRGRTLQHRISGDRARRRRHPPHRDLRPDHLRAGPSRSASSVPPSTSPPSAAPKRRSARARRSSAASPSTAAT